MKTYLNEFDKDVNIQEAYSNLCNAVVIQAIRDYKKGNIEAENFLRSDRVKQFTNLDMNYVLDRIEKEKKENEKSRRIK